MAKKSSGEVRMSESQLQDLLQNNDKLKVHASIGVKTDESVSSVSGMVKIQLGKNGKNKSGKVSLSNGDTIPAKKKNAGVNVYRLIQDNKQATIHKSVSDKHFSVALDGARVLSINQIFAILQKRKEEIFAYKKYFHKVISDTLTQCALELAKENKLLPYFDDCVEITLFRQAPRLVDEDALTAMFKYMIDGLKRTPDNPHGILADDNPKIVHNYRCYNEIGEACLGLRVRLLEGEKKETYSIEKILLPE
jgi:hypothetical protein